MDTLQNNLPLKRILESLALEEENKKDNDINEEVYQLLQFDLAFIRGTHRREGETCIGRFFTILLCILDICLIIGLAFIGGYFHKKNFLKHFRARDHRSGEDMDCDN